jgi:hypothetical protein
MNSTLEAVIDPATRLSASHAPFVCTSEFDRKGSLRHARPAGSENAARQAERLLWAVHVVGRLGSWTAAD